MSRDPEALSWGNALGRAIKVRRTDLGMSRTELAERVGLSYPYLSEIENGKKRPSDRVLRALAQALDLRTHELVADAEARVESMEDAVEDADAAYLMAEAPSIRAHRSPVAASRSWERSAPRGERADRASVAAALRELEVLLGEMGAEDVDRIVDLARRLAR